MCRYYKMDYHEELLSWFLMDETHPDYEIVCTHGELLIENYSTVARASVQLDRKNVRSPAFWNSVMDVLKGDLVRVTSAGVQGEAVSKLHRQIAMVQKVLDAIA